MPTKTKTKPAAPSARETVYFNLSALDIEGEEVERHELTRAQFTKLKDCLQAPTQPESPKPTARELRMAEVKRQFDALRHFAKVIYDDIGLSQFESLCNFKRILDHNDGSTTPVEDFIVSLIDTYARHDDDGQGLTLEDIEWQLRQSITGDDNLSRTIKSAHFIASRYPLPEPEKADTASSNQTS